MLRVSRFVAVGVLAAVVAAAPVRVWAQESPATPPAADTPPAPAPAQTPATPAPAGVATLKPAAPDTNASIIERVLVRVNGEVFTQSQLTQLQIERLRDMERPKDFNLQATLAKITPDLLVQAVDELLLVQRGRELGVTFTDKQFQDALDNVKKANNLDDAGLQKALKEEGETMETLRQRFERSYLEQAVQQRENRSEHDHHAGGTAPVLSVAQGQVHDADDGHVA